MAPRPEHFSEQAFLHRQAVEELFDDYAENFEDHLVGGLGYRGPEVIAEILKEVYADCDRPLGLVVDLGCGTGLCGPVLRPRSERLVGIDVSSGMLEVARTKGRDGTVGGKGELYEDLLHMDAAVGLGKQPAGTVDLISAGDMFIYVWSPDHVFQASAKALKSGGYLVLTTEHMEEGESEDGWIERESERFAHAPSYIIRVCTQCGFDLKLHKPIGVRKEHGGGKDATDYLAGDVYVFQRSSDEGTAAAQEQ
mmetsp:Transcript_75360/g.164417  ORF Transcript_75360/g.164417 Transcript_75360/m.164417 type:complete len:252 (+) Transcript_75360:78-833(+)